MELASITLLSLYICSLETLICTDVRCAKSPSQPNGRFEYRSGRSDKLRLNSCKHSVALIFEQGPLLESMNGMRLDSKQCPKSCVHEEHADFIVRSLVPYQYACGGVGNLVGGRESSAANDEIDKKRHPISLLIILLLVDMKSKPEIAEDAGRIYVLDKSVLYCHSWAMRGDLRAR